MKTLPFHHSKRPQMPTALPKPLTPATQTSQSITVQDHGSVLPREACDDQGGVWLPSTARAGLGSLRDLAQRLCCRNPKPTACVCNPNQTCWCYLDNVNIQIKQKVLSNSIVIIFELSSSSSLTFFCIKKEHQHGPGPSGAWPGWLPCGLRRCRRPSAAGFVRGSWLWGGRSNRRLRKLLLPSLSLLLLVLEMLRTGFVLLSGGGLGGPPPTDVC